MILLPSDKILQHLTIKSIGAENIVFFNKFADNNDIIIKVSRRDNTEYKIYKALKLLNNQLIGLVKIYGIYTCIDSDKKISDLILEYDKTHNNKLNFNLCLYKQNTKKSDLIDLKMIVIENVYGAETINDIMINNKKFPNDIFVSLMLQGLYIMFNLYSIFGIVQNDYNPSNILIKPTSTKKLKYNFTYNVSSYYKIQEGIPPDFNHHIVKLDSHGLRLYLIDFDNALILHTDYAEDPNANIKTNIIEHMRKFLNTMYNYALPEIADKIKSFLAENGKYWHLSKIYVENKLRIYNKTEIKCWSQNAFVINRTAFTLYKCINELITHLNLSNDYKIFL